VAELVRRAGIVALVDHPEGLGQARRHLGHNILLHTPGVGALVEESFRGVAGVDGVVGVEHLEDGQRQPLVATSRFVCCMM
jgi:orotidine-5'-phosphate decarboxylase